METTFVSLKIHGDIRDLVRPPSAAGLMQYPLNRRATIKDIIEAIGVPHTEIGRIICDELQLTFDFIPAGGEQIELYPFTSNIPVNEPTVLRPEPFSNIKFLVDTNVAKLARNLRMAGFDATAVTTAEILKIARQANDEERIILTRNRELLKVRTVCFGQLLHSENPLQQMVEVVQRYNLQCSFRPFSRCLCCNGVLIPVEKEQILDRLEPLTKKYYNDFEQCGSCGKIYWCGSHHEKMAEMLRSVGTPTYSG